MELKLFLSSPVVSKLESITHQKSLHQQEQNLLFHREPYIFFLISAKNHAELLHLSGNLDTKPTGEIGSRSSCPIQSLGQIRKEDMMLPGGTITFVHMREGLQWVLDLGCGLVSTALVDYYGNIYNPQSWRLFS